MKTKDQFAVDKFCRYILLKNGSFLIFKSLVIFFNTESGDKKATSVLSSIKSYVVILLRSTKAESGIAWQKPGLKKSIRTIKKKNFAIKVEISFFLIAVFLSNFQM